MAKKAQNDPVNIEPNEQPTAPETEEINNPVTPPENAAEEVPETEGSTEETPEVTPAEPEVTEPVAPVDYRVRIINENNFPAPIKLKGKNSLLSANSKDTECMMSEITGDLPQRVRTVRV